ncbi:Sterol uptake control protein 2 [Tolypocladium ophioglossoides CBS 100239]|uniref:Sterol uptake control protein 2 n=1 Tax=Tolypocladium ophioglossoides (strain CBS 100239) TaxID=1163406 RepID=A0A0L0NF89_TOLOC|nr:Sterol uptake control protein 2 [Tolypocladium ophioglossoides CBS 100239]
MAGVGGNVFPLPVLNEPPREKTYHPKRPHKKSRRGCRNCKVRKVKCDEAKPECRTCRIRGEDCLYLLNAKLPGRGRASASASASASPSSSRVSPSQDGSPVSLSASSSGSARGSASPTNAYALAVSRSAPPVLIEPSFRPAGINETDMKLLWFFTANTCSSFSVERGRRRPAEEVMRTTVVKHAFETPFLMHSLFALASLHRQMLQLDFDRCRALEHRDAAFTGYQRAVEHPTPPAYPALLAHSLLLTAITSQNFREPDSAKLYIINWMLIWRGIGTIFERTDMSKGNMAAMASSGLQTLFHRPKIDLKDAAAHVPGDLQYMIDTIQHQEEDHVDKPTYYTTLRYLASLYQNLRNGGFGALMKLRIITWFTFLPQRFVELVRDRRPRALIIIAHYAAFLKLMGEVWWLQGVGDRSLQDLCEHIDHPMWVDLFDVPKAALAAKDDLEVARILVHDKNWVPRVPPAYEWDEQQEYDTRRLTWVDNEGREIRLGQGLVYPQSGNTDPTWHNFNHE